MRPFARISWPFIAFILVSIAAPLASYADDEAGAKKIDIAPQPLATALQEFSEQSGLQVAYVATLAQDVTSKGARDATTPMDALAQILDDTGLEYQFVNDDTVAIGPAAAADKRGDSDPGNGKTAGATPRPVMMAKASAEQSQTRRRTETDSDEDEIKRPIEEIIVTGTNIRGIAPESSPTRVYTREHILRAGFTTAQDFIKTLPQNFGGDVDESFAAGAPGNEQAGNNDANGSGVNLRGLGSGSTLVLLNGRRLAPSSDIGGFTDISMIPVSAIERIEVLTDGASSIYGADAVAGVVNFVLRNDYDGAEASLRYGAAEGDMEEYRASLTGGANWDSGNGLIVYEYYKRDNLGAEDREFSKSFLLPNDLLPRQERHSVLGSLSQQLTPDLEIGVDILLSQRDSRRVLTVLAGPSTGRTTHNNVSNDNHNIGSHLTWNVASDWYVDMSGNYSKYRTDSDNFRSDGSSFFRNNDADHWSIDAKTSGTVIELPGGPAKLGFGGHYRQETFLQVLGNSDTGSDGHREVYAFFGEMFLPIIGVNNGLPGVRRLEVNVSGRFEDYSDFGSTVNPKIGLLWAPIDQLRLRGSYSTSFKPPTVGQTGALDRGAVAFPTSFLFDVFGIEPADPSIADVVLLTPFGTSDDLDAETSRAFTGGLDYDATSGPHKISFSSTYFDIKFENRLGETPVPNNRPLVTVFNIAFESPELFPTGTVIFFPIQDELDAVLDGLNLHIPASGIFGADPADTAIISFASMIRNLSITEVRGVDFDARYSLNGDFGSLILGIAGTYLINFEQQASVTTPVVELLDTQYHPLDLHLRGHIGYERNSLSANVFVNYADDYRVDNTVAAPPIKSWTTADLSLSYDTMERYGSPLLDNTVFRLSIINLFDQDPPAAPAFLDSRLLGFDPTNASPLGRFIAFELTKRF